MSKKYNKQKNLTKKQLAEYTIYTLASIQFFGFLLLAALSMDSTPQLNAFDAITTIIGMASLYSIVFVSIAWIFYGLYKADGLFIGYFFLFPLVIFIFISILQSDMPSILYWLSGKWMSMMLRLILCLISVGCCSTAVLLLYRAENDSNKAHKVKNPQGKVPVDDGKKQREMLMEAISQNAIEVAVHKGRWHFASSDCVLFGYNEISKEYVFVDKNHCHQIKQDQVVFLDCELSETQQLECKFFYISSGKAESTVLFTVLCSENLDDVRNSIQKLRGYYDILNPQKDEIKFRRKVRKLATRLDKNLFPNRPYQNKDWFSQLEEHLSKYNNDDGTAYSIFKSRVLDNESCYNDELVWKIICSLSKESPDYAELKKAAKQLCHKSLFSKLFG